MLLLVGLRMYSITITIIQTLLTEQIQAIYPTLISHQSTKYVSFYHTWSRSVKYIQSCAAKISINTQHSKQDIPTLQIGHSKQKKKNQCLAIQPCNKYIQTCQTIYFFKKRGKCTYFRMVESQISLQCLSSFIVVLEGH